MLRDYEVRVTQVRRVAKAVEFAYANLFRDVQESRPAACATFFVVACFLWAVVLAG
jgi:hypothetical protein